MTKITKISLKNLTAFSQTELYKSFENKPISLARISSYLNNPHAHQDDVILYLAFIDNELVGYRTVFAGIFYYKEKKEKFAWLSGNWTHPKHRRKKISTLLFKEVKKDWNAKLIYSNYSIASRLVYNKTQTFSHLKTLDGIRFYRRFSLAKLLPSKHPVFKKTAFLLKSIDYFLNLFIYRKKIDYSFLKVFSIQKIDNWKAKDITDFLIPFKQDELFKRNPETYSWITKYPWIKTDSQSKEFSKQYYFSSYASVFENDFYSIKKENKIVAILHLSIRDKHLKVSYFYGLPEGIVPSILLILRKCETHTINYLTLYHEDLIKALNTHRFLYQKEFRQSFYITSELLTKYPKIGDKNINIGDGDSVFT